MHRRLHIALTIALLALFAAPVRAKDVPADKQPRMADAERIAQRNLQVMMQGQKAGGAAMRVGRMKDGGTLMEYTFLLKVKRANGPRVEVFVMMTHSLSYYDADHKLRWTREREEEAGAITKVSSRYTDTHVEVEYDGPGMKFKKRLELPKDHGTDYRVFRSLLAKFKRGEKAHAAYSSLDAKEQVFKPNELTIVKKTTVAHGGESHEGYSVKTVSPAGTAMIVADEDYLPMRVTMMGVIEGVWIDGSPFDFSTGGWEISSYVPVEGVAPMSAHLEKLEVTVTTDKKLPDDKPIFLDNRYQKVKRDGAVYHLTLSSTRLPAGAKPLDLPLPVNDEKIKRYLAATPKSQSDHATIIAQAKKIVGVEKDALTAVERIVVWVYRTLEKKSGARGDATAVEVLKSRVGDCSEHAALTVALCRATGLPARNVGGLEYLVLQDNKPAAGYHAWAEVWLGQWVGIDATIPEVGTAARYVMFEIDEPGEEEGVDEMIRAITSKIRLRIDAYQHAGGERTIVKR